MVLTMEGCGGRGVKVEVEGEEGRGREGVVSRVKRGCSSNQRQV